MQVVRRFKEVLAHTKLSDERTSDGGSHWCARLLSVYGVHAKQSLNVYSHVLPNVLRDATDQMAG